MPAKKTDPAPRRLPPGSESAAAWLAQQHPGSLLIVREILRRRSGALSDMHESGVVYGLELALSYLGDRPGDISLTGAGGYIDDVEHASRLAASQAPASPEKALPESVLPESAADADGTLRSLLAGADLGHIRNALLREGYDLPKLRELEPAGDGPPHAGPWPAGDTWLVLADIPNIGPARLGQLVSRLRRCGIELPWFASFDSWSAQQVRGFHRAKARTSAGA